MLKTRVACRIPLLLIILFFPQYAAAGTARIAVASNFTATIKQIVDRFEKTTDNKIVVALGSTGKIYAQIEHGARFDAFFAADERRPVLLEKNKRIIPGSRFTYAIGKIALWSSVKGYVDSNGKVLAAGEFNRLSIANPKLAPYGKAAQQVLQAMGLWQKVQSKLVFGENINQAFQFVMSGNAKLGFVALSQLVSLDKEQQGSYWIADPSTYQPIEQQAVLLTNNRTAGDFMEFVRGSEASVIIRQAGYNIP
ncbi:MAG: molybdate ABC transporter substrate-binding protein [Gammaproteobacteria bacterium]|jgi:molybdate transport system substrate-binding protein